MNQLFARLKGDRTIWLIVCCLSLLSILAVYSSTGTLAYKYQAGNTEHYILKHMLLLAFGLGMMYLCHLLDYRYYSKLGMWMLYASVPLLIITLGFGTDLNEAKRWITLPGINVSFQTSDLAKLALIMYLARIISRKQEVIDDFKEAFLPTFLPVAIVCLLIMPADFSTAVILFLTCLILMFVGRINWKHMLGLTGLVSFGGIIGLVLLLNVPTEYLPGRMPTWKSRIESYMHGDTETSYQVAQSKIAIAKGGIMGQGPGNSNQRNFLPHPYSDFIYAIIIEEYGFLGGFIVLFLYLALLLRAVKIVVRCPKAFGAFLAFGLSLSLVLQALINMGVSVNLLPVTGLTLPFVSMGGTSMVFTSISIGILLSVSRSVDELVEEEELKQAEVGFAGA